jgi:transcription elongation GreA/GreB family factor
MSRAFVKENDDGIERDLLERPVSAHRNLVTSSGLEAIEQTLRSLEIRLSAARASDDAAAVARLQRDARYWRARRSTAELVPAHSAKDARVRFGSRISIRLSGGEMRLFRIVGEDEADPSLGLISYVAPVAKGMLGADIGDTVDTGAGDGEVLEIS